MRTTVDLPDDLFRELKSLAAPQGLSLKDMIEAAVRHELTHGQRMSIVSDRVKFPVLKSKQRGSLTATPILMTY